MTPSLQRRIITASDMVFRLAGRRPRRSVDRLSDARAILVIRPDEIGDVVLTTPFLRELRRNAPKAWITLAVKPAVVNLVETCPHVNEIVPFDARRMGNGVALHRHLLALSARRLWRRSFDLALLPRSDADFYHAGLLALYSGAARRVGYSQRAHTVHGAPRNDYDAYLTQTPDCPRELHEVRRNLLLLASLGGRVQEDSLELTLTSGDHESALAWLGGNASPHIAVGPGGAYRSKLWPPERFAAVAKALASADHARVVLVGDATDTTAGDVIRRATGSAVIDLTGRTTLRQAAAVLKRCALLIANDTGPAHLAAAVKTPVVVVSCHARDGGAYALNDPARFGPWQVPSRVCRPESLTPPCIETCNAGCPHCILAVTADEVLAAAQSLLTETSTRPTGDETSAARP